MVPVYNGGRYILICIVEYRPVVNLPIVRALKPIVHVTSQRCKRYE